MLLVVRIRLVIVNLNRQKQTKEQLLKQPALFFLGKEKKKKQLPTATKILDV